MQCNAIINKRNRVEEKLSKKELLHAGRSVKEIFQDMWRTLILFIIISLNWCSGSKIVKELPCDCGLGNNEEGDKTRWKFVEGNLITFAPNHAWPWMASIVNVSIADAPADYCGGSLINNRYILTAGHCIPEMQSTGLDSFRIYLGTNLITPDFSGDFLDLGIDEILTHPRFSFETAEYDVALIKLRERVKFSKDVRPVCLKQPPSLVGKEGVITGWGSYNLTTPTEEELKQAEVIVVSNEECNKTFSPVEIPVTDTMLCASVNGKDPCKGDSGGPLVLHLSSEHKNRYSQIGIISHGEGCNEPQFPTIFSRVSMFTDWIEENTRDAFYCRDTF